MNSSQVRVSPFSRYSFQRGVHRRMRHDLFPVLLLLLNFILFLVFPRLVRADEHRQFAYGVHQDFYDIAHTRIAQIEEKTALECEGAGKWYRRSLRHDDASLGEEEEIQETLLVDWKWTSNKLEGKEEKTEQNKLKKIRPQQYKFEIKGGRLIIHATRWHDLGQYYCVVGDDVTKIYLLYQRPIILYVQPEGKKNKYMKKASSPTDFVNQLEELHNDKEEEKLSLGKKGVIVAKWRAYPFVDKFSSGPKGLMHSKYNWDEGDVCRWMSKIGDENNELKRIDVEDLKKDKKRYKFSFDALLGEAIWTINPTSMDDDKNQTLQVCTSRGCSITPLFVRIHDDLGFLYPLIAFVVELVVVIIVVTIFALKERGQRPKGNVARKSQNAVVDSVEKSRETLDGESYSTGNNNAAAGKSTAGGRKEAETGFGTTPA